MERTEYKDEIFELKIEGESFVHILPDPKRNTVLLGAIQRLQIEAGVSAFKAEDVGGGAFVTTVEHSGGTYSDRGQLINGEESITWPEVINNPYPIKRLAALLALRVILVKELRPFHPTLFELEFT